jgi:O-antigen/teichoic acid export membrane protein
VDDYRLNFINKATAITGGLISSVIVARYLGVTARGDLAFVIQTAGLLAIALGLGFNQAFPYYFRSGGREAYDTFMRIFICQFLIYSVLAIAIIYLVDDLLIQCICAFTVVTVLYQQVESVMAAYRIRLKIWVNIAVAAVRVGAYVAMAILLPPNIVWPLLISCLLWLLAVAAYLVGTGGVPIAVVPRAELRSIISFSWLPMLSSALVIMNYNIDVLMLKWLGDPTDLGLYAVASGIVVYLWVIPDAIKEVLVSRVARTDDVEAVIRPLKAAVAMAAISVVAVWIVGDFMIVFLFGSEFAGAYPILAVLSLGVVSMVYFKILGVVMLAEGRRTFYFATLAVAVAMNVIVNLFAIPAFGAVGAAGVSVLSYSLTGCSFLLYFSRLKQLRARELVIIRAEDVRALRRHS